MRFDPRSKVRLVAAFVVASAPTGCLLNWDALREQDAGTFDATWLGNGCTPPVAAPTNGVNPGIGPAGGILVCPLGDPGCTPGVGKYTGTNTTP